MPASRPDPNLAQLTAAVLIGGAGTRLRPAFADRPKALAPVRESPFLSYLLDQLSAAGIRNAVLCTGFMGDLVRKELGDRHGDLRLSYSHEEEPLGTAGALRLALPELASDPVLVLNGDSYCESDLPGMLSEHLGRRAEGTLLVTRVPDTSRYGRVLLTESGRVRGFEEKGGAREGGWINAGIYLLGRGLLESVPAQGAVSLEREMFPAWTDGRLHACRASGRFLDIGTPESYAEAERFFAEIGQP